MSTTLVTPFITEGIPHAHHAEITDIALSSDGLMLLSCSKDSTAKVWDARSSAAEPLCILRHPSLPPVAGAFLTRHIALTVSVDGVIRLFALSPSPTVLSALRISPGDHLFGGSQPTALCVHPLQHTVFVGTSHGDVVSVPLYDDVGSTRVYRRRRGRGEDEIALCPVAKVYFPKDSLDAFTVRFHPLGVGSEDVRWRVGETHAPLGSAPLSLPNTPRQCPAVPELPLSRKFRKKEKKKKACRSGEEGERQREISDVLQSALDEVSELKRQRNQWIEKIKRF